MLQAEGTAGLVAGDISVAQSPYPRAGEYVWKVRWGPQLCQEEESFSSLTGSKDPYPAGTVGTVQDFLREGDLFCFPEIALCQCVWGGMG